MIGLGGEVGYRLLRRIGSPEGNRYCTGAAYNGRSKLEALFGQGIWAEVDGKVVVDFGCGSGDDAVELARRGAARVIGVDIRESALHAARRAASRAGVGDRCTFATRIDTAADVILSVDAFEHFEDPAAILRFMHDALRPGGVVLAAFGPPWYHPYGGHLFSVFPWAHLLFGEEALIRWRSDFKTDGATRFSEVEGGLNQMTLRRFASVVQASPLRFDHLEMVPIRRLGRLGNYLPREYFTATVRCRLVARHSAPVAVLT